MEINKGLIKINLDDAFIGGDEIKAVSEQAVKCHETVINKSGKGNDFLGWVDLPSAITEEEIKAIEETAYYLRRKSRLIVSIGIGGSYLGARAVTTALGHAFKPLLKKKNRYPEVIYAGQNIGEDYHSELIEALNDKKYSIIVISKSGTTTEPAVAFRILKNHIEKKYGREVAATRIVAITDRQKGALKKLAGKEGYKTFVIPDDVGGRFSVLTPVGLLPIAAAGFDIRKMLEGAKEMEEMLKSSAS
ncbi:MAG: glucose-6-phosphate isomerase, partial [Ignavibacteriae bacterium]|nr:glucose-6-phosphate isomerase [Ignavibacteriota bacterium]